MLLSDLVLLLLYFLELLVIGHFGGLLLGGEQIVAGLLGLGHLVHLLLLALLETCLSLPIALLVVCALACALGCSLVSAHRLLLT